jgi:hypothetical protein
MDDTHDNEHAIMDKLADAKGFETEDKMIKIFKEIFPEPKKVAPNIRQDDDKWFDISYWYSKDHHELTLMHHQPAPPGMVFGCDDLADMWIERWMKTPKDANPFANPAATKTVGQTYPDLDLNSFVLASDKADVYFVYASAFQEPDFRRVLMHRKASVLIPVYFSMASRAMFPSLKEDEKLIKAVQEDLGRIEYLKVSLDGKKLYGCTVLRKTPLRINNIPKNNIFDIPETRLLDGDSMEVYHGGFWVLTTPLEPGDHLLYFESKSKNYEMQVKMLITTLA